MTAAREMEGYDVVVVGGGNSAGQAAIHLAKFAQSVTILVRREGLEPTMSSYLIGEIAYNPRITVLPCSEVVDGGGDGRLEWIRVRDTTSGEESTRECRGLFLLLGAEPHCDWLPPALARDERGFVLTGRDIPTRLVGRRAAAREPRDHRARGLRRRGHPGRVDEAGRRRPAARARPSCRSCTAGSTRPADRFGVALRPIVASTGGTPCGEPPVPDREEAA